jgi:hypothetical protein
VSYVEDALQSVRSLRQQMGVLAQATDLRVNHGRRRKEPDDMLNVVKACFRSRGADPNRFVDKFEFDTICEQTRRINAASFGASDDGVAIEVPFGTSTALIVLNAKEVNPRIGAGLGTFLQLPIFASFEECARMAAWLNRKEAMGPLAPLGRVERNSTATRARWRVRVRAERDPPRGPAMDTRSAR